MIGYKKIKFALLSFAIFFLSLFSFFAAKPVLASTFTDSVITFGNSNPTGGTLHLAAGTYNVDADFTVPYSVTIHFDEGAIISVAEGATLKFNGPIDDCHFQIFSDNNSTLGKGVRFQPGTERIVRPEWWGAKADNNPASASINASAIEKAMWAFDQNGGTDLGRSKNPAVQFSIGKYYIDRTIPMKQSIGFAGEGDINDYNNVSVIRLKDDSNCSMFSADWTGGGNMYGGGFRNIYFHGGNQSAKVSGLSVTHNIHSLVVTNCAFDSFSDFAIYFSNGPGQNRVEGNVIKNCYNGIRANAFDGYINNNNISFKGDAGVMLIGYGIPFQNNHISGGSTGKYCLTVNNAGTISNIYGNTLENCDYGIFNDTPFSGGVLNGMFTGNTIRNNRQDGVHIERGMAQAEISGNTITGNGGYGINTAGGIDSLITHNDLSGNGAGPISTTARAGWTAPHDQKEVALIEDNTGVDLSVGTNYPALTTEPSAVAPRVTASRRWQTSNTSPLTITSFSFAPRGKEIFVSVNDNNTTLKFLNGSSYGPERMINGSFDTASNWTLSDGWTYDSIDHSMKHAAGTDWGNKSGVLEQSMDPIAKGEYYEIKFTIRDYQSGIVTPNIGYGDGGEEFGIQGNGTHVLVMRVRDTNSKVFRLIPIYNFAGTIDDVSVKKVDTTLRGFGGGDKKFALGDSVHCTKGPDAYWYCDNYVENSTPVLLTADLNSDSKVDATDLTILQADFMKTTASLTNPKSDIDKDGTVTLKDMGILMSQWKP